MEYWQILAAPLPGVALLLALSRKWCLPGGISALIILGGTLLAVVLGGALVAAGLSPYLVLPAMWACQIAAYVAVVLWHFYRDPERRPPGEVDALVSPADGKVIYIRKLPAGQILQSEKKGRTMVLTELNGTSLAQQELWQVGISMVFTDVHVNRASIAGTVALVKHRDGDFLSLRRAEAMNVNERQTMMIEGGGFQIAIVQIASRLVRRIEAYVREGESLILGQRIGIIKFGSQVDLFVPTSKVKELCIAEDQRLIAGETVIGRLTGDEQGRVN